MAFYLIKANYSTDAIKAMVNNPQIDRDYRIQAWNRKREAGTQGVVREEAIGRTVFDILHRQPHSLIKQEFDRVFRTEVTAGCFEAPTEFQISGVVEGHYAIRDVPPHPQHHMHESREFSSLHYSSEVVSRAYLFD